MSPRTKIKVCGVTRLEDAAAAVENGAEYIGLIFVASSPRKTDLDTAKVIVSNLNGAAKFVGVFQNNSIEEIKQITKSVPLNFVQFHGQESPDFCQLAGLPAIKTIEIQHNVTDMREFIRAEIDRYSQHVQYVLFDRPKNNSDNNWLPKSINLLKEMADELPDYFFGGGLNARNIELALTIDPYAIDVASGIESAPGIKDYDLMKLFCRTISRGKH